MNLLSDIRAYEILDSRGNPTLKTELIFHDGKIIDAAVPSGASKGTHEAVELRDGDLSRYRGLGLLNVINMINTVIKPQIVGKEFPDQKAVDDLLIALDGTQNKSHLGANTILSISLAFARAFASYKNVPLFSYIAETYGRKPALISVTPMFNIINGGLHSMNGLSIQEFLLVPNPKRPFKEAIKIGIDIYQALKEKLILEKKPIGLGDEGGYAPHFEKDEDALELLKTVIETSGYKFGEDVSLSLDLAASTYYKDGFYTLSGIPNQLDLSSYIETVKGLVTNYQLFSIEDPIQEDDWEAWATLTRMVSDTCLVIGDDLLVTNLNRLNTAIEKKACNAILVKPNQIGTVTETLSVIRRAREANFKIIISHRSGETNDDFIADLAVGVGADFVKFGAPARGERVAKYNRLSYLYERYG